MDCGQGWTLGQDGADVDVDLGSCDALGVVVCLGKRRVWNVLVL